MNRFLIAALVTGLVATSPALAKARHHRAPAQAAAESANAHVVERDSRGRASKVEVDGQTYAVCTATVVDSCINPRQAGLRFGNEPLDRWPGKPASST